MNSNDLQLDPKYKGVAGWLLFFCFLLIVINPLTTIVFLIQNFRELFPLFNHFPEFFIKVFSKYPGLFTTIFITLFLITSLSIFSIYAGIALWKVKPGAVTTAKNYLYTFLIVNIVIAILPFTIELSQKTNTELFEESHKTLIRTIFSFTIWYMYLIKSKRVKATYTD